MPRKRKRRFVFDTNVLISAALTPEGEAWSAFEKANRTGYFLLSDETFAELKDVLYREDFDQYLTNRIRRQFIIKLLGRVDIQPGTATVRSILCRSRRFAKRDAVHRASGATPRCAKPAHRRIPR